ncbi:MAG: glutamine synthetase [Deltaproteobacteria bacterium]|nr:MAG: glutamine synthetase [Deltaproteobacteria bacterium]
MKDKLKEEVLRTVKNKNVKFIKLWFVDILGQLKSFVITGRELSQAFSEGMGFDGSSVEGFARIYESDLVAVPDPATFQILPWIQENGKVARMFCDILNPDRTPYEGDPRYVLKRNLEEIKKLGYKFLVGPELEYFYFKSNQASEIIDQGGYFDFLPLDVGHDLRRESISVLEEMGIKVEYAHHEVAPSQHEIDLRYTEALSMADNVMTYKVVVKQVAINRGIYATFMPKPIFGVNGSGMHTHQSLFKNGKNAFFNANDKHHLSKVAKSYIAGLLKHASEITAVLNQWVNSYKRLVPGYEAPVYIAWARRNRSTLVRIPMYRPGKGEATRAEFRSPDPACNPYLAFSLMLGAGMNGIKERYGLPEPVEEDVYDMSMGERAKKGIESLPGSLIEAIALMEKSKLAKKVLGEHVFNKFIANKKIEWDQYRTHVTDYEIKKYLPVL